jgi:hypothetical protein
MPRFKLHQHPMSLAYQGRAAAWYTFRLRLFLHEKTRLRTNADRSRFREKSLPNGGRALLLLMLFALLLFAWYRTTRREDTGDYEGRIVDRWADYVESNQGSRPRLRLVVEAQDGKRFTVKVEPAVYESARVGMRIKSRAGQVVLIDSEQRATGEK